eukprot:scaffold305956_cov17-Tisochrysis_lutea.AAC.1
MQSVSQFRLKAHALSTAIASWDHLHDDGFSPACNRCSCRQFQDEVHVLFMCGYERVCAQRRKYFELIQTLPASGDSSLAQTFLRQQLSVKAAPDFLLQHDTTKQQITFHFHV